MALQIGLGLLLGVLFIALSVLLGYGVWVLFFQYNKKKDLFADDYNIDEWFNKKE